MNKNAVLAETVDKSSLKTRTIKRAGNVSVGQILLNLVLAAGCLIAMLPFMWTVSTSLRPQTEAFRMPPDFLPTSFMYQNYLAVFQAFPFFTFMLNSLITAVAVVLLSLTVTSLAGFAFARINFRFKNTIFMIFMAGLMVPGFATLISTYLIMAGAGLVNTLWALI
ncbi:MAG: hypothetical protein FWG68_06280, partial [Defluviitaleaceae bacterium]|nr:hypothetical protein [Defluviitaleaceae bacterium]